MKHEHVWGRPTPGRDVLLAGHRVIGEIGRPQFYVCQKCGARGYDASPAAIARLEQLWGNRK